MIQIQVNGTNRLLPEGSTLAQLLQSLELGERRLAIELNQRVIPRSEFDQRCLHPADRVEIVHAIGGG